MKTIYQKLFEAIHYLESDSMIDIESMQLAPHDELTLLFERINVAMQSIKQFNTYVSHEIKTPLMMASSHLDIIRALLAKKQYKDIQTKIPQIQHNLQEIAQIVDVLGKFILIENKSFSETKEEVKICETLLKTIDPYKKEIQE